MCSREGTVDEGPYPLFAPVFDEFTDFIGTLWNLSRASHQQFPNDPRPNSAFAMTPTDVDQSILTRLFPTEIRRDLLLSSSLYLFVAICAAGFREYGDEPSFKHWANQAHQLGIHNAYKWGYDWLPLYLYVAKSVGWAYHCLGFASWFGDYSRALTFVLKVTMIALSAGFGVVVWHLASHANVNALRACRYCAYCPGLLLATGAFGYQDAFHTLIVTVAVLYAIRGSGPVALGFALGSLPD